MLIMPPKRKTAQPVSLIPVIARRVRPRRRLLPRLSELSVSVTTQVGFTVGPDGGQQLGNPAVPDIGFTSTFFLSEISDSSPLTQIGFTHKFVAATGFLASGRYRY